MPTADPRTSPELRARLAELESAHREAVAPAVQRLATARERVGAAATALEAAVAKENEAQARLDTLHTQHEARTLPLYAALGRNACHGEPTDAPEDAAPVKAPPAPAPTGGKRTRRSPVQHVRSATVVGAAGGAVDDKQPPLLPGVAGGEVSS